VSPVGRKVSYEALRGAIEDVIAGGPGATFEATPDISVEQARAHATKLLLNYTGDAAARVRITGADGFLHIQPFD
jgi:hypothetical protein